MVLTDALIERLKHAAEAAAKNAYCPYSGFPVGASVLSARGEIFSGCNVENASYGLTICAERSAIFHAVNQGHREIVAVAIVGPGDSPTPPCGACRQVINEFGRGAEILCFANNGKLVRKSLADLLPDAFGPDNIS